MGELGRRGGELREPPQENGPEKVAEDLGISVEELKALEREVEAYKESLEGPQGEIPEGDLDELLARAIEKSAELSPDGKKNLKKWVRRLLGIPETL